MRDYLGKGAHGRAMRIFSQIADGKVLGFEAKELPLWPEVHRLWKEQGRDV